MHKAIVVTNWVSSPAELTVSSVPDIACGDDEVEIKVHFAGVNFFDALLVKGLYQTKPKFPFTPGAEFSGVITRVGSKAHSSGLKLGNQVFGTSPTMGGFGDKIIMKPKLGMLFNLPNDLSLKEASGLYFTYPTSWAALSLRANLKAGEICLVHAGAGGVGTAAIQFAKFMGAIVIATAGSDIKTDICKLQGADYTINYRQDPAWPSTVNQIVKSIPNRKHAGVDVVFDPVGLVNSSLKCIAWNGRIVVVGFAGLKQGESESITTNRVLLKNVSLMGLFWGAHAQFQPTAIHQAWQEVFRLFRESPYRPVIYPKRYIGLENVKTAIHDLETRSTYGKCVVDVADSLSKL